MGNAAALQPEPQPIIACTISHDVQDFDLLIEDMEAALGERWGDLTFAEALAFFDQPDAQGLQFVAVALNGQDEDDLGPVLEIIAAAKQRSIKVILIAEDVSPGALHQLLKEGGDEFVPYPLPEGELSAAIDRVTAPPEQAAVPEALRTTLKPTGDKSGVVIPVQGMAGGTGATTLAVNLAWELANVDAKNPPRVCLIDLGFQFGSVATYLDLPRRESVLELLSDTEAMDSDSFMQSLLTFNQKVQVLTAPTDLVPNDMVTGADVARLIEMARVNFDYVVIDVPTQVGDWYEQVLTAAHVYFATLELDMRSAQNVLRLKRGVSSEGLPFNKLRFVLNRAPGFTDLSGKSRVKRLAESLGIAIEVQLCDGGKQVTQNADHGVPMGEGIPKNALRKDIAKLAKSVHDVNKAEEAKAA